MRIQKTEYETKIYRYFVAICKSFVCKCFTIVRHGLSCKIFALNEKGIISVRRLSQNGIVNRCWLDARIGRRLADAFFAHKLPVTARASDNKFSARCTRSNFSKRVYLAANDPMIYLCTLADVYLYAVPGELRGGSQESSFTEARAIQRKVIPHVWTSNHANEKYRVKKQFFEVSFIDFHFM